MTRRQLSVLAASIAAAAALGACRGQPSEKPPIYVFPDMDWQEKIQGQEEFKFWPDGRGNRQPVDGTVARGHLREDDAMYLGKVGDAFVAKAPITVDAATLARGEERYNIYCAPCHDRAGSGKGMVMVRTAAANAFPALPELYGDRVRGLSDGEIFTTITNGIRNMPGYAYQIPTEDRWAIVAWVRVIGRSQWGNVEDVPADKRGTIEANQP